MSLKTAPEHVIFKCIHYYLDAGSPVKEELSTGEALRLIGSVAELDAKSLVFTGGKHC